MTVESGLKFDSVGGPVILFRLVTPCVRPSRREEKKGKRTGVYWYEVTCTFFFYDDWSGFGP